MNSWPFVMGNTLKMRRTTPFYIIFFCIVFLGCNSLDKNLDQTKQKGNNADTTEIDLNSFATIEPYEYPCFPGGDSARQVFFDRNVIDSILCNPKLKIGFACASFTIDTLGQVVNEKILRSYNTNIDNEFLRVIKLMPKWTPGKLWTNGASKKIPFKFSWRIDIPFKKDKIK